MFNVPLRAFSADEVQALVRLSRRYNLPYSAYDYTYLRDSFANLLQLSRDLGDGEMQMIMSNLCLINRENGSVYTAIFRCLMALSKRPEYGVMWQRQPLLLSNCYYAALESHLDYDFIVRSHLRDEYRTPSLSTYLAAQYPSYDQKMLPQITIRAEDEPAQEQGAQQRLDLYIHQAAAQLNINLPAVIALETEFANIEGLGPAIAEIEARKTQAAWNSWYNNIFTPWLEAIARTVIDPQAPRDGRVNNFSQEVRDFQQAWSTRTPHRSFEREEAALRALSWQQLRNQHIAANDLAYYNPWFSCETTRLIAFIVAYTQSPHFQRWSAENRHLFYHDFLMGLGYALPNCQKGTFERTMILCRDVFLRLHRNALQPQGGLRPQSEIINQFFNLCLNVDIDDPNRQTFKPSSVLMGLFLRTMASYQQQPAPNALSWQQAKAVFWEHREEPLQENISKINELWGYLLEPIQYLPTQNRAYCRLSPDYQISEEEQQLVNTLGQALFDEAALRQTTAVGLYQALMRGPAGRAHLREPQQQQLLRQVIEKKYRILSLKNDIEQQLAGLYPPTVVPAAQRLLQDLQSFIELQAQEQQPITVMNALFARVIDAARQKSEARVVAQAMRLKAALTREIQQGIPLQQIAQSQLFAELRALCESLSQPVIDITAAHDLNKLFNHELLGCDTPLGRHVQASHQNAIRVVEKTYFTDEVLPDIQQLPLAHDFLIRAAAISGLPLTYLQTVLALLGRTTQMPVPLHEDPFEGEERPVFRGLKKLFEMYHAFIQQGPGAHEVFLDDRRFKMLIAHHFITIFDLYQKATPEEKTALKPYMPSELPIEDRHQGLIPFIEHNTILEISQIAALDHDIFYNLLHNNYIDIAHEIIDSWSQTGAALHVANYSAQENISFCRKILSLMHQAQNYQLFDSLLAFTKLLDIKQQVFDTDLSHKLYYSSFAEASKLIKMSALLAEHGHLSADVALAASKVRITGPYLRSILRHWEDFSFFACEQLQQHNPQETRAALLSQQMLYHIISQGLYTAELRHLSATSYNVLMITAIHKALSLENADLAKGIFDRYIAAQSAHLSAQQFIDTYVTPLVAINDPIRRTSILFFSEYFQHCYRHYAQRYGHIRIMLNFEANRACYLNIINFSDICIQKIAACTTQLRIHSIELPTSHGQDWRGWRRHFCRHMPRVRVKYCQTPWYIQALISTLKKLLFLIRQCWYHLFVRWVFPAAIPPVRAVPAEQQPPDNNIPDEPQQEPRRLSDEEIAAYFQRPAALHFAAARAALHQNRPAQVHGFIYIR